MRRLQTVLFLLAIVALLGAIPFAGSVMGDVLWRAGIAALLVDVVCIMLWPQPRSTE
ncbi:MAG: hypothetical protein LJE95_13420 [Acidobacteria bacterium]|jgi:hypothetical protein|nr:hypothetical protein [Acidobacteriota bacterium]